MYYVYDFANGWSYPFETKEELALWWRGRDRDFNELNVTGNDVFVSHWYKPVLVGEECIYISISERCLRRFQVFDDDGRSIDIRIWPKFVWAVLGINRETLYFASLSLMLFGSNTFRYENLTSPVMTFVALFLFSINIWPFYSSMIV